MTPDSYDELKSGSEISRMEQIITAEPVTNIPKLTCLSSSSLFELRQVTRYFVSPRNEPSTSVVRWSLDDR
jgi:hypothetical protein